MNPGNEGQSLEIFPQVEELFTAIKEGKTPAEITTIAAKDKRFELSIPEDLIDRGSNRSTEDQILQRGPIWYEGNFGTPEKQVRVGIMIARRPRITTDDPNIKPKVDTIVYAIDEANEKMSMMFGRSDDMIKSLDTDNHVYNFSVHIDAVTQEASLAFDNLILEERFTNTMSNFGTKFYPPKQDETIASVGMPQSFEIREAIANIYSGLYTRNRYITPIRPRIYTVPVVAHYLGNLDKEVFTSRPERPGRFIREFFSESN